MHNKGEVAASDHIRNTGLFLVVLRLVALSLLLVAAGLLLLLVLLLVVLGGGAGVGLGQQALVLLGQGHWGGQMVSDGTESVLIGHVLHRVLTTVVSLVRVESLGHVGLVLLAGVLHLALLDHLDAVGALEAVLVGGRGLLSLELDDRDELALASAAVRAVTLGLLVVVHLGHLLLLLLLLVVLGLLHVVSSRGSGNGGDEHGQDDEL